MFDKNSDQRDVFLVGSSVLRAVKKSDVQNGFVQSVSGGKVTDVKNSIINLDLTPKTIVINRRK